MRIVSCKQARQEGLKRYFTGKPCKRGHVAERHVAGGCVECDREDQRRYYKNNPEEKKAESVAYREGNREITRKIQRDYYARNSARIKAEAKTHRGNRALRVPRWSEVELIEAFYRDCPDGYEVDHILPLQGKTVSGLHVIGNLQYLPRSVNRSKHNKVF